MATPTPRRHQSAADYDEEGRSAAWAFVWILIAFKLITIGLIFYHMHTFENGLFLGAMTWFWLIPIGALVAGPLLFRYRLHRVRARREQLRRAEWMLQPDHQPNEHNAVR